MYVFLQHVNLIKAGVELQMTSCVCFGSRDNKRKRYQYTRHAKQLATSNQDAIHAMFVQLSLFYVCRRQSKYVHSNDGIMYLTFILTFFCRALVPSTYASTCPCSHCVHCVGFIGWTHAYSGSVRSGRERYASTWRHQEPILLK